MREGSDWRLFQWNSSRVFTSQTSGNRTQALQQHKYHQPQPAGIPNWDFNVSVSTSMPANWSPTIRAAKYNDILLVSNGTFPAAGTSSLNYHNVDETTLFAISLKPGEVGRILWTKNFQMTFNDGSQNIFTIAEAKTHSSSNTCQH